MDSGAAEKYLWVFRVPTTSRVPAGFRPRCNLLGLFIVQEQMILLGMANWIPPPKKAGRHSVPAAFYQCDLFPFLFQAPVKEPCHNISGAGYCGNLTSGFLAVLQVLLCLIMRQSLKVVELLQICSFSTGKKRSSGGW